MAGGARPSSLRELAAALRHHTVRQPSRTGPAQSASDDVPRYVLAHGDRADDETPPVRSRAPRAAAISHSPLARRAARIADARNLFLRSSPARRTAARQSPRGVRTAVPAVRSRLGTESHLQRAARNVDGRILSALDSGRDVAVDGPVSRSTVVAASSAVCLRGIGAQRAHSPHGSPDGPGVLIIAPSKDAVAALLLEAERTTALRFAGAFGGAARGPQIRAIMRGAHIVVGTPARLVDLHGVGALRLSSVRLLVVLDAERTVSAEDVPPTTTLSLLCPSAQRLVCSSAWPRDVDAFAVSVLRAGFVRVSRTPHPSVEEPMRPRAVAPMPIPEAQTMPHRGNPQSMIAARLLADDKAAARSPIVSRHLMDRLFSDVDSAPLASAASSRAVAQPPVLSAHLNVSRAPPSVPKSQPGAPTSQSHVATARPSATTTYTSFSNTLPSGAVRARTGAPEHPKALELVAVLAVPDCRRVLIEAACSIASGRGLSLSVLPESLRTADVSRRLRSAPSDHQALGPAHASEGARPNMHAALVVAGTRRAAEDVTRALRAAGHAALLLHTDKPAAERTWVLAEIAAGRAPVLVVSSLAVADVARANIPLAYVLAADSSVGMAEYAERVAMLRHAPAVMLALVDGEDAAFAKRLHGRLRTAGMPIDPVLARIAVLRQ